MANRVSHDLPVIESGRVYVWVTTDAASLGSRGWQGQRIMLNW